MRTVRATTHAYTPPSAGAASRTAAHESAAGRTAAASAAQWHTAAHTSSRRHSSRDADLTTGVARCRQKATAQSAVAASPPPPAPADTVRARPPPPHSSGAGRHAARAASGRLPGGQARQPARGAWRGTAWGAHGTHVQQQRARPAPRRAHWPAPHAREHQPRTPAARL